MGNQRTPGGFPADIPRARPRVGGDRELPVGVAERVLHRPDQRGVDRRFGLQRSQHDDLCHRSGAVRSGSLRMAQEARDRPDRHHPARPPPIHHMGRLRRGRRGRGDVRGRSGTILRQPWHTLPGRLLGRASRCSGNLPRSCREGGHLPEERPRDPGDGPDTDPVRRLRILDLGKGRGPEPLADAPRCDRCDSVRPLVP